MATIKDSHISRPVTYQPVDLQSAQAMKVYKRAYLEIDEAFHRISVVLPIIGRREQTQEVSSNIDGMLTAIDAEMKAEMERLGQLMEENGIETEVQYSLPQNLPAPVSTPRSFRFLGLLAVLDTLVSKIDALWLAGFLDDHQHSEGTYRWQKRMLRFSNEVRTISVRADRAARDIESGGKEKAADKAQAKAEKPEEADKQVEGTANGEDTAEKAVA